jgi:hypothetical protein
MAAAPGNTNALKHGHTRGRWIGRAETPEYQSWGAMLARCNNPRNASFKRYGGRGLAVCKRWYKFENFLADMGPRPTGHILDRINNNKNYGPKNCRWAPPKESANNRHNTFYLTAFNKTQPLMHWARETGIYPNTIRERLRQGWSPEDALTHPVRIYIRSKKD